MKKADKESIAIARHIHLFLNEYAPTRKTGSENTLKNYRIAIEMYLKFLEEEKEITPYVLNISCFCHKNIEEWLVWMKQGRGNSNNTCNVRLASLRTFLAYLGNQDARYLSIPLEASKIERMKQERHCVNGISRQAMKILLEVPDQSRRTGKRDLVFMLILYTTACRLNEVLSIRIKDICLDCRKPHVTITGKGSKIRTLYLMPKAITHIRKYIGEFHGEAPDPEAYLFFSRNKGLFGKLSETAAEKIIHKNAAIAHCKCPEIPLNLHPHQFRHSKSTHWLEDGINIVQISSLLGHENLETTMVYIEVTNAQHTEALVTLETEAEKEVSPKWKNNDGSLRSFCGLGSSLN